MIPLSFVEKNRDYIVKEIRGSDKVCLLDKGLCIGNKIRVLEKNNGSFIVRVNDTTKYALGFGLANKIIVADINKI